MKMTDMKRSRSKSGGPISVGYSEDDYPYGLEINLEPEDLKKLNLDSEDLAAGAEIDFCVTVKVTSVRQEPNQKTTSRCSMQIIKMGEMPETPDKPAPKKKMGMYSEMKSAMGGRIRE